MENRLRLVGPATLMPSGAGEWGCEIYEDMAEGLRDADVVMMLRLQKERMDGGFIPSEREYYHRWGLDALRVAAMMLSILALPMLLFPAQILGIFFTDPALLELGTLPLRITAVMIVLDAAALVLAQALMGAGAQRTVMLLTLGMQWLVFLPLAWWVGIVMGYGLVGVWLSQLCYRLLNSGSFLWVWQRRRWLAHSLKANA